MYKPLLLHSIGIRKRPGVYDRSDGVSGGRPTRPKEGLLLFLGKELDAASCLAIIIIIITC